MMASSEGRERRYELRVCKAHGRRGCPYPECAERHCETSVEVVPVSALEAVEAELNRLREFAFGDAPEWEKANTSLKHEARDARQRAEEVESRLRVAVEALTKLVDKASAVTGRLRLSGKAVFDAEAWALYQAVKDAREVLASLSDRDEP